MPRAGGELAITHGAQLPAQGLLGDREAELLEHPLAKINNPPAGVVTLSEIGPIWTINQQAKSLKSLASTLAVVGKFRSV